MSAFQVDRILVDFRLSRGDGLEFKKHFGKIRTNCKQVIEPGPILWPAMVATSAIPGIGDPEPGTLSSLINDPMELKTQKSPFPKKICDPYLGNNRPSETPSKTSLSKGEFLQKN